LSAWVVWVSVTAPRVAGPPPLAALLLMVSRISPGESNTVWRAAAATWYWSALDTPCRLGRNIRWWVMTARRVSVPAAKSSARRRPVSCTAVVHAGVSLSGLPGASSTGEQQLLDSGDQVGWGFAVGGCYALACQASPAVALFVPLEACGTHQPDAEHEG
jgi:hypothetical protein